MTRPPRSPATVLRRELASTRGRVALGIATALVVLGLYGLWYLFFRPAGPAAVDLGALSTSPGASNSAGGTLSTIEGTWTVDTSIGSGDTGSFVGYRIKEQLASIGATTAVGRTPKVSGTFDITGSKVTAATITADVTALASDDGRRDGQLTDRGLETDRFPTATFVLSGPIDLGGRPADGQIVKVTANGQLTMHGQTQTVQIALEARLSGSVLALTGSLPITLADFGIKAPTSMMALSVEDHGTLELQLLFAHA